jgi:two-component system chemotaxis response regulator CheV
LNENNELDEYELDLVELINSNSNSMNQYLVFEGSNDEVYAVNISKVVEVLVYKKIDMVKNGNGHELIRATAKIRDEIATIICFDEWFGNDILSEEEYEYVILAGFGGYNLAIMVKNVEYIVSINSEDMKDNSINNEKTNFIANIKFKGQDQLCTIFDCDKLLLDTFKINYKENEIDKLKLEDNKNIEKFVFFADDSIFIRKIVESLFIRMNLKYKIFHNAKDLLDELNKQDINELGLIITDLEMPVLDGRSLIKNIRENSSFDNINIIVHTNMSNFIIKSSLIEMGACEVISKIDMKDLSFCINKYIV